MKKKFKQYVEGYYHRKYEELQQYEIDVVYKIWEEKQIWNFKCKLAFSIF